MVGLILVAQLEDGKIKCALVGISYFFATYFHVVLLINEIFWPIRNKLGVGKKQKINWLTGSN